MPHQRFGTGFSLGVFSRHVFLKANFSAHGDLLSIFR
jgi:hypothetical protein